MKFTTNSMMTAQNKMLSVLGRRAGGTQQIYRWIWSSDVDYMRAKLKRPAWVLCRWKMPQASAEQWNSIFQGIPYPQGGYYAPWLEMMIADGQMPPIDLTQNLVYALDAQLSTTQDEFDKAEMEYVHQREFNDYNEWVEFVQDSAPAFNNFESGRSGHVSYGGI